VNGWNENQQRIIAASNALRTREQQLANTPWHEREPLREARKRLNREWEAERQLQARCRDT
jgi:hypothetical protein